MKFALNGVEMDWPLQRTVTAAYSGSADIGEATARRVIAGGYNSWHNEWAALAGKTVRLTDDSARAGSWGQPAKAYRALPSTGGSPFS